MSRAHASLAAALLTSLLLAACIGSSGSSGSDTSGAAGSGPTPSPSAAALEPIGESAREDGPSALDDPADERLPEPLVDPARIVSGGPPPDGIPPIDQPFFERASAVDWIDDSDGVLSLTVRG